MNQPLIPRPQYWVQAAEQKKNRHGLLRESIVFYLLTILSGLLQAVLSSVPLSIWMIRNSGVDLSSQLTQGGVQAAIKQILPMMEHPPVWLQPLMLSASAITGVAAMIYCTKVEKRKLSTMGLTGKAPVLEYITGLIIGFGLFGGVYGIGHAAGVFRCSFSKPENSELLLLAAFFFAYLMQGAGEELMIRGYFAVSVNARYPVWISVFTSSLLFTAMHVGNNAYSLLPALNIFLVGIFFCLYIIKRGSIWGACAIHSMWNFTQGCIFGLSVSGTEKNVSVFQSWISPYNKLLTGGDFGPEGSLCTTVVLLAAILVVFALKPKDAAPAASIPQETEMSD